MLMFRKVLSAFSLKYDNGGERLHICQCNNPKTCLLYQVSFNDDEGFNKCGIWYAPVDIEIVNENNELI